MKWPGRSILRITAACIFMGALPAILTAIFRGMSPALFLQWTLYGMVYAWCIAIPSGLLMPRVMSWSREYSTTPRIALVVATLVVFSFAGCLVANLIFIAIGRLNPAYLWPAFFWSIKICLAIALTFGLLTTAFMTLRSRLAAAEKELHRRQIAEERERKIAAEARFASLESRVHPHFLFNTLNSISALIRENPSEAERMIERLSALLRYSLDSEHAGLVPLQDELRIVGEYLAIEHVRFGPRLRYSIHAEPGAASYMVPALAIQTLVENSVKYAAGASRQGAEITVTASVVNAVLRVTVSDTGPGFDPVLSLKPGHGLDLLRRRLEALFGPKAALEIDGTARKAAVSITVSA